MKKLIEYFFQGIILVGPLALTIYIFIWGFQLIDGIIDVPIPGIGFVLVFAIITFAGFMSATIGIQPVSALIGWFINRTPLVKMVYTSVKDLFSAFMGKDRKFNKPVLVKLYKGSNVEKFGFITQEDLTDLGISADKITVYCPHSYAFSGELFVVSKDDVTPLEATSAEIMKLIVSGGITRI